MKKVHWMLFKDERNNVHYFWDDKYPILVHIPKDAGEPGEHYWMPINKQESLIPAEEYQLRAFAESKKQVFRLNTRPQRFLVVSRGTFSND